MPLFQNGSALVLPTPSLKGNPKMALTLRTYIYIRESDGKCVHLNAGYGFFGQEYEHDDPAWQPPADWPYEIIDYRKEVQSSKQIDLFRD